MKEPAKASSERLAKPSFLLLCLLRTEGGKREQKRPDKSVFDVALTCHALRTDEKRISPHEGPPIKAPDTGLKEGLTEGLLTPLSRRPSSFKPHFCLTSAAR
ncbi:hypothetical protein Q8A67_010198 [Cirrhinus molitorella]|uniref:Uncharacterized protein n=1 Tax=Cirrhinus molitorella TaxID=172907 RepID=A0AA88PYZ1_9TELE|nr:hypothetical protein Q8A67_010198 [Cirrhinus molitorella]